jgi:hypothetical protein
VRPRDEVADLLVLLFALAGAVALVAHAKPWSWWP